MRILNEELTQKFNKIPLTVKFCIGFLIGFYIWLSAVAWPVALVITLIICFVCSLMRVLYYIAEGK